MVGKIVKPCTWKFVNYFISQLNLKDVTLYAHRTEDHQSKAEFEKNVNISRKTFNKKKLLKKLRNDIISNYGKCFQTQF